MADALGWCLMLHVLPGICPSCRAGLDYAGLPLLGRGGPGQPPLILAGVQGEPADPLPPLPSHAAHAGPAPPPRRCQRARRAAPAGTGADGQPFRWVARRQRKRVSHYHECGVPPPPIDWLGSLDVRK